MINATPPCSTSPITPSTRDQNGMATLGMTLVILGVLALVLAFTHRQLIFEWRSSVNQQRAATAFEAAQAGLDWGQALLNSPQRIDTACHADTGPDSRTLRDKHWLYDPSSHQHHVPAHLTAACLRDANGWRCHCPDQGSATLDVPENAPPAPGFVIQLVASPRPGQVTLTSKGCSHVGPRCWSVDDNTTPAGQAQARLQVQLALTGGLHTLPAAPVTARGHVKAVALGAHHAEARTGGRAIHAGTGITIDSARISTAPGGSTSQALVSTDPDLAQLQPEKLFTAVWGMPPSHWAEQSSVQTLRCASDCTADLQAAVKQRGNRMVHIAGDATLSGPVQLGSPERPLLLVVQGQLTLQGAVRFYGAAYTNTLHWRNAQGDAQLMGAAWSQTDIDSDSAPDFVFDLEVLEHLRWATGSLVPMPGSWKDF